MRTHRTRRVNHKRHSGKPRNDLLEKLQALSGELGLHPGAPGRISARAGEAGDEPANDGIATGHEYDRNFGGHPLRCRGRNRLSGEDEIHLEAQQIGDERGQALRLAIRRADFDREVRSLEGHYAHQRPGPGSKCRGVRNYLAGDAADERDGQGFYLIATPVRTWQATQWPRETSLSTCSFSEHDGTRSAHRV